MHSWREVESTFRNSLKSGMIIQCKSGSVSANIDNLAAYYFGDLDTEDVRSKEHLTGSFKRLGDTVIEYYTHDLERQQYLRQGLQGAVDKVRSESSKFKGSIFGALLDAVETVYPAASVDDPAAVVNKLVTEFAQRVSDESSTFCSSHELQEYRKGVPIPFEMAKLKEEIADVIADCLSKTATNIFRQRVLHQVAHKLEGRVNRVVSENTRGNAEDKQDSKETGDWHCR